MSGTAAYRDSLRRARPSPALEERVASAIDDFAASGASRRRVRRVPPGPAIAAGVAALVAASVVLWLALGQRDGSGVESALGEYTSDVVDDGVADQGATPPPETATHGAYPMMQHAGSALLIEPAGTYSLWPTESAVFRLQTRLDTAMPAFGAAAGPAGTEQRYWVDVRVANDGSMRIVRIVPVDEGV